MNAVCEHGILVYGILKFDMSPVREVTESVTTWTLFSEETPKHSY